MCWKDLEIEEESRITTKGKMNYLVFYHFNFSNQKGFFDISKLKSLFEVTFGSGIFRDPTKEYLREEKIE